MLRFPWPLVLPGLLLGWLGCGTPDEDSAAGCEAPAERRSLGQVGVLPSPSGCRLVIERALDGALDRGGEDVALELVPLDLSTVIPLAAHSGGVAFSPAGRLVFL